MSAYSESDCINDVIHNLAEYKMKFRPGERMQYASINYDILAYIVEYITKVKYSDYLHNILTEDLGMYNTYTYRKKAEQSGCLSKGYKKIAVWFYPSKCYKHSVSIGSGYLISNIRDIRRWAQIQLGIATDVPDWVKRMIIESHKPNKEVEDINAWYYGWGWYIHMRKKEIYHMGNNPNFSSCIILEPKEKKAVCILMNSNSSWVYELANSVIKEQRFILPLRRPTDEKYIVETINMNIIIMEVLGVFSWYIQSIWMDFIIGLVFIFLVCEFIYVKIVKSYTIAFLREWINCSMDISLIIFLFLLVISYFNL